MYCVLFVMTSTNIEKKIQLFQRRDMSWQLMFFSGRKLGHYADQELFKLLKSLFQNKTPDIDPSGWLARWAVRIKKKKAKRKSSVKKRPNRKKKKTYKDTENSVAGVEPGLQVCKQLLDHCTTLTHVIKKIILSYLFAFWSWCSCIYHEFKYTFEEN